MGTFTDNPLRKDSPTWIVDENECHIWTGARNRQGYGQAWDGEKLRPPYAIRYEREVGPIPDGMVLDHYFCDNGPGGCCNPHHVRPVTPRENVLRSDCNSAVNAAKTHCKRGHELVEGNLLPHPLAKGKRECRTCARERSRQVRKRKAQKRGPRRDNAYKTHCKRGHPLSGDNLAPTFLARGLRRCIACTRIRDRRCRTNKCSHT